VTARAGRADRAEDERFMRRCLALARRAEGRTAPNPIVGAVVVGRGGRVLAEGWHRHPEAPHGEADALAKLGGRAPGATLYVSLEPCAHAGAGRRRRPCVELVREAGVRRLVFGLGDPFPGHGGGADLLRRAGVEVVGPVLEDECRRAVAPFLVFAVEGRAHATLKAAITLDGRIATAAGESRWITGEAARRDAHRRRDRADAVLVGAGTVAADDPLLTTRGVRGGRDAVRVVLDGRLRMSPRAALLASGSPAPTLIIASADAPERRARALAAAGAEVVRLPGRGTVSPRAVLRELARRRILSVLVEGGAETHAAFLRAGLCDRLLLYVAPKVIGGRRAQAWIGGAELARLTDAAALRFDGPPRRLGEDLLLEAVAAETSR
jgi:diaminohydroxyphosphoribosylaminopyrimidine deaminase / 5-amino-6-(5-phosphoribosylamino)uracil reductase